MPEGPLRDEEDAKQQQWYGKRQAGVYFRDLIYTGEGDFNLDWRLYQVEVGGEDSITGIGLSFKHDETGEIKHLGRRGDMGDGTVKRVVTTVPYG